MRNLIIGAAFLAATMPAMAQTNVSISVGQPGFYGRIDIGDFGPPPVVYAQPVIIEQHHHYRPQPVYLRVPPGHRKNWKKHCKRYGACGQPVMFVRDEWYHDVYAPRYQERHGHATAVRYVEPGGGHGHGRGKHDKHDKHDKRDKHGKHGKGHD